MMNQKAGAEEGVYQREWRITPDKWWFIRLKMVDYFAGVYQIGGSCIIAPTGEIIAQACECDKCIGIATIHCEPER